MTPVPPELVALRASRMAAPVAAAFAVPAAALKTKFGASLAAVLLYGSCRRRQDAADGVVDLYVIVDDYRAAYPGRWMRWLNATLPPNVFYLEVPAEGTAMRVKYAVLSLADFERGARSAFHSYFWARFCQPVALLYARDAAISQRVAEGLGHAVLRFLREVLPMLPGGSFDAPAPWLHGFELTYGAELRPESNQRADVLVSGERDYYEQALVSALVALPGLAHVGGDSFIATRSADAVHAARRTWRRRRWLGKVLSVLRLAKSAMTFSGGVDYAAWKVERHTGMRIEITPRLRRHPLLFGWRVLLQLLRRGALR
ncbi:MAG: hypothetical protein HYR49_03465 [Gammaproteobacteria bacterium]|nr:hypothetical protein [Gammaproteobacteria bacterium]